jgi:hypothetical protein
MWQAIVGAIGVLFGLGVLVWAKLERSAAVEAAEAANQEAVRRLETQAKAQQEQAVAKSVELGKKLQDEASKILAISDEDARIKAVISFLAGVRGKH